MCNNININENNNVCMILMCNVLICVCNEK